MCRKTHEVAQQPSSRCAAKEEAAWWRFVSNAYYQNKHNVLLLTVILNLDFQLIRGLEWQQQQFQQRHRG
jgi:hypothetical protein